MAVGVKEADVAQRACRDYLQQAVDEVTEEKYAQRESSERRAETNAGDKTSRPSRIRCIGGASTVGKHSASARATEDPARVDGGETMRLHPRAVFAREER